MDATPPGPGDPRGRPEPPPRFDGNIALRTIGAAFLIGQRVRHVNDHEDDDDRPGIVTGASVRVGSLLYDVTWGRSAESPHLECELLPLDDDEDA